MELVTKKRLHLFTGRANPVLAQEIAHHLGIDLGDPGLIDFANGEIKCRFQESVRGGDVFIIQTHAATENMSVNDAIMEHLIMVDAARRASAKRITAVAPFYGYARQDRKAQGREPITARLVSDLLRQAGADRLVSIDLHSGQIQGFFEGPVDHLTAAPVLIEYLEAVIPDGSVIVSPDTGRVKVAERYAKKLDCEVATIYKRRSLNAANEVEALGVMGDVNGRTCVIIDDMVDTAGTICAAVETLTEHGAADVLCATTHAVFSGPAVERLESSALSRVVVTDTVPLPDSKRFDKLEVLSAAGILADALESVFEDTSVSEIFDGENHS